MPYMMQLPANPPKPALNEKALLKIVANIAGTFEMLYMIMPRATRTYIVPMSGTR